MGKNDTIKRVLHLPHLFNDLGNRSIDSLLKDTGYFEMSDQICEDDISNGLTQYPEYVKDWKQWSDDKRTSSGWYFEEIDEKKYIVGYFDTKEMNNQEIFFSDIKEACAFFIKHEIESIRLA